MRNVSPVAVFFHLLSQFILVGIVNAQSAPPEFLSEGIGNTKSSPAVKLAQEMALEPGAILGSARVFDANAFEEMAAWNRAGKLPLRNGFSRTLSSPIQLDMGLGSLKGATRSVSGVASKVEGDRIVVSTSVRVDGAYRLRMHLANVPIIPDTEMWVWGADGQAIPFGLEVRDENGEIWTPSVYGDRIYFEIRLPSGSWKDRGPLVIDRIMQLFPATMFGSRIRPRGGDLEVERQTPRHLTDRGKDFPEIVPTACILNHISCGGSVNGELESSDCGSDNDLYSDWYKIQVSANQKLSATVQATGEKVGVGIFDPVAEEYLNSATDEDWATVVFSTLKSQELYLVVWFSRNFGFGKYDISVECGVGCFRDVTCISGSVVDVIDLARRATARMEFVKDNDSSSQCTGALLTDTDDSNVIPYFLTANHCLSSSKSAASVEAFWDDSSNFCNGSRPVESQLPRSLGSSLVATSKTTDFTLLRLNSIPPGRALLGWTSDSGAVSDGTIVHRVSHPLGMQQLYSQHRVHTLPGECATLNRPFFIYSQNVVGATTGGSSGAPAFVSGGYVIGQNFGKCGADLDDFCNSDTNRVDGAFAYTYPAVKAFLNPGGPSGCSECVQNSSVACLLDGRFKVEVRWRNQFFQPVTEGEGKFITYAENAKETHPTRGTLSENLFITMFPHAPKRVELVIKMFKGDAINNHFWITAAGLTNNEYWITVTDTKTCKTWVRANPHNQYNIISDQWAFPVN